MLVLLSGVSGAGKDTIKKELLKRMDNVVTMPSYTDRLPRPGETNGGVYNFVTTEEFEQKIKEGEFYEYSVHHEHYYGTSKKVLNEKIQEGKIIVKDIEVNGTENLLKLLKDDLKIVSGNYKINSQDDGIRGKDSVYIQNGTFDITTGGGSGITSKDSRK